MTRNIKDQNILNLYKPLGISPLDVIKIFCEKEVSFKDSKMTYVGRLDPMAEGVLVVLAGDAVYEKDKYLKLPKEYEAEVLFGFKTDTFDILGLPIQASLPKKGKDIKLTQNVVGEILKKFIGKFSFFLPPFSSYRIKGKPLFWWARQGKLSEIEIPKRVVDIEKIKILKFSKIKKEILERLIEKRIGFVKGDFRQREIIKSWKILFKESDQKDFNIIKIKFNCSSGTYIRSIADELGRRLKTGAALLSLKRTKVGDFDLRDSIKL